MITLLSLVTSVKDYVEVVHKLIESDSSYKITNYEDLGPILTYTILSIKEFLFNIISLNWLKTIWNLPIIIPDISSAIISEISVLNGYFHNAFNFLDTPISYGDKNLAVTSLEKLTIGFINSLFLFLPTTTAHLITLRRFVMQGLEAGYIAGLGSIAGSVLWITSIIFGWRFIVIPWLSLDIFRYMLGFILLVKYMWDSYNERKMVLEDISKQKIFLLNFLLALTEQTSIYPFISNMSVSSESSLLESFPAQSYLDFITIHGCYILGLVLGSLSLLHLTCWFWENPAFKIYMWMISSFKVSTNLYYKILNFTFLYLTMICAISSIPYYGLDYTLTNPLGFVQDDRIVDQKLLLETSFLNTKASDRNTRRNRGRHGRRERWKRRIRKYRTFDASLYDQGIYDLFTIEDLNYGFDRFWLRRKMRNHRVRFRFFPGPWMRSFKKQLAKPRLESYAGPRQEFFRILFEQVYHPNFHEYKVENVNKTKKSNISENNLKLNKKDLSLYYLSNNLSNGNLENERLRKNIIKKNTKFTIKSNLIHENSMLRKFVRKINSRIKSSEIKSKINLLNLNNELNEFNNLEKPIYSKRWKQIFSRIAHDKDQTSINNGELKGLLRNFYQNSLSNKTELNKKIYFDDTLNQNVSKKELVENNKFSIKKQNSNILLSKQDKQILKYRSLLLGEKINEKNNSQTLFHPLKFYLQKQQAFERKLHYYTPTIFRKFAIENNAPYFRVMLKRYFYYYKPTLRWERTMKVASLRKARRKGSRTARKIQFPEMNSLNTIKVNSVDLINNAELANRIEKSTNDYSIVGKRASRYRYQIYKDVLQHWYYSPFNRLLLKFDIDLFIKRQPNAHFLTKNEENLLHLRRVLLSEHYDTLRWYTSMQHYRSMKTKIGGTKSFASRTYNQQFQGTFKKIRHLFAITPSQGNQSILKFDQPLYNETFNNSKNNLQQSLIIHEELLPLYNEKNDLKTLSVGNDLVDESTQVIRNYLNNSTTIKQEYIKKLIKDKNYLELTQFLYKGQKTRGTKPTTNQSSLLEQEKDYLLSLEEKNELKTLEKLKLQKFLREKNLQQDLWIDLLKKWKRKINDQEFLKNYLQRRVEKREKLKQKKEKNLKLKLKNLEDWLNSNKELKTSINQAIGLPHFNSSESLTTGVQKALLDGVSTIKEIDNKTLNPLEKSICNTSICIQLTNLNNQEINKNDVHQSNYAKTKPNIKNLKNSVKLKKEKEILSSLKTLSSVVNESSNMNKFKLNKQKTKETLLKFENLSKNYSSNLSKFIGINKLLSLLKPITKKSIKNWQQKERALNKQKKSRKEFKALSKRPFNKTNLNYQQSNFSLISQQEQNEVTLRKKRDFSTPQLESQENERQKNSVKWKNFIKETYVKFFTKKFKRKKSPQRRSRIRRNRGVTKKRTLSDSLKREFKNLRKYGETVDNELSKKVKIYNKINFSKTELNENLNDGFNLKNPKQRRSKQRKQRSWKQKRSKYSQKLRKYRKRRRNVLGKIRVLNKQLKKTKAKIEIQNWWWKNFLPNIQATTDSLWQLEKDRQIQQKLLELSVPEILERDKLKNKLQSTIDESSLQIGNTDFKPLSIPEAIRLRENTMSNNINLTNSEKVLKTNFAETLNDLQSISNINDQNSFVDKSNAKKLNSNTNDSQLDLIDQITQKSILSNQKTINLEEKRVFSTNSAPFYAGWDESLRKFIVTNRLLSRREAGFEIPLTNNSIPGLKNFVETLKTTNLEQNNLEFTDAPLKGMNAATTLYWQIPFTTYDPDQFFALGMDGFAPIGWKRFQFRHSILKSWLYEKQITKRSKPIVVKNKTNISEITKSKNMNSTLLINNGPKKNMNQSLIYKLKEKNYQFNQNQIFNKKTTKNIYRRLKKRYRRVKKHPRSPVWFPSGALLNQVLPVHYIYIFYKRSRLPRDRYLKRRLRKSPINNQLINTQKSIDFTLRKRVKTKRKYHRKQDINKKGPIIPRRMKFIGDNINQLRWRPLSRQKINKPISELMKEQRALRTKQRKKDTGNKQPMNMLRIRQLRRRVQRQIIRSVWRYKPRAGGFIWPGDYLKLESVKAPKLKVPSTVEIKDKTKRKIKRKKKRTIQEWQIQSKKYLLEKHNYNVIKKKLQKSQRSNKIRQKIKELNLTF
uniref:hypothetical chloroplast protein RF1 n=1 Tax=Chlamydomonas chlamydogama TaxID=225041 RepID=UPI00226D1C74|nr:hypothetical chloroplast protein RF1 [Chlamydomonas chlamydogama]UZA61938.1 hypothetical chloroplast protein RF1 [Chlamydomonas chlamydogama]